MHHLNLVHADIPACSPRPERRLRPTRQSRLHGAAGRCRAYPDKALGPDVDAPKGADKSIVGPSSSAMGYATIGAIKGSADGQIPYRR